MKKLNKIIFIYAFLLSTQLQAVHISDDGTGEVLIFPYYTVNGGYDSLVTIINTTDQAKALRVRFREAANSREVFAFNLYLGPNDEWVGAVSKGNDDQNLFTRIITPDDSCTVPAIGSEGQLFTDSFFIEELSDNYGQDVMRMHEGFLEVIEMGEMTGPSASQITLDYSNPDTRYHCSSIDSAWNPILSGQWASNPQADMLPPTGGITGSITLINVGRGTAITQQPTAIDDFSDDILHFAYDSDSPSLADGNATSRVIDSKGNEFTMEWEHGFQAVTSVLMKSTISNEYALSDSIGAQTSWVVSLPTKQFHTDELYSNSDTLIPPFDQHSKMYPDTLENKYCGKFTVNYWDTNTQIPKVSGGIVPPPTPPPPAEPRSPILCYTTSNIVIYNEGPIVQNNGLLDSNFPSWNSRLENNDIEMDYKGIITQSSPTPTYFKSGWISAGFEHVLSNTTDNIVTNINGLPIIGFSVQQYVNGALDEANIANYAGIFNHKTKLVVDVENADDFEDNTEMRLAEDKQGQVLIYPYYTVNNGIDTLLTIANTTDEVKALKIKFLEGKNSRECLSFNVYIDAYDVWTSALTQTTASPAIIGNHQGEPSAKVITADNSCIVPNFISETGQEFLPYAFDIDNGYDGLGRSLERCTEGHIEVIEMGVLESTDAAYATHTDKGIPANCSALQNNWVPGSNGTLGKWCDDDCDQAAFQTPNGFGDSLTNMLPPTGGLNGTLSLINVAAGIDATYDAIAIENFTTDIIHSFPGSIENNLSSGSNNTTAIMTDNELLKTNWARSIDAVSSLFMQSEISNEFVINPAIGAQTEWVNMYPTKQFYVDPVFSGSELGLQPFTQGLIPDIGACNLHRFKAHNQEQLSNSISNPGNPIGPPPPFGTLLYPADCWSVNVADVNFGENLNTILGSLLQLNALQIDNEYHSVSNMPFTSGWMKKDFLDISTYQTPGVLFGLGENGDVHIFHGRPVLGFTVQSYTNGSLMDDNGQAILANYGLINMNTTKRYIGIIPD